MSPSLGALGCENEQPLISIKRQLHQHSAGITIFVIRSDLSASIWVYYFSADPIY